MSALRAWLRRLLGIEALEERVGRVQEALGRSELRQLAQAPDLASAEFGVYSQWGEDGAIQWLLRRVPVEQPVFVEFGVGDYSEANTRFLLVNDGWRGLVIDSSAADIARLRRDPVCWRHPLATECAWVTAENIDGLLAAHRVAGKIGLLSIDIDGNDYWVWEAIRSIEPAIVIVEYNARFGAERAVTIPYQPEFDRRTAHYSWIYYGASLAALAGLGRRKGYALVGCNRAGNNAFFVRRDRLPPSVPERAVAEAFVPAAFREARGRDGALAFLSPEEEALLLQPLPLVDVSDR
jgi:hypothetical protein